MPTIQHTMDVVRLECLTAFPLSHYILSEDGTHLILLDNCADNYRIHGNFSKIEETSIEPLTTVEEERIAYANPRFHKYIEILRCQASEQDPPISLKTIRAIKRLVDESLYPVGLLFGYDYDQKQMVAAERAYGVFAEFLHRMPQEERQKLNRQHIIFNNKRVTFAQVLRAVQQDECIAVYGQYLAQLVMDYAPYLTFQREIELRVDVNKMRSHSRQKVPSDYAYLSHEDALKRLLIIYKSLMTHNFSCWPLHGISISGLGVINTVPPEVNKIFSLLMPMVLSGNFIPAVAVYAEMMESVIKPALRDKSWKTWMTRYNDTHSWLVSIANQTLFTQKDEWFEPKFLLVTLFPLAQDRSFICPPLKVFLEKLVYIYLTSGSQVMRDAMINAQFATLLRDLDEPVRNYILSALKASEHLMVEDAAFHEICATQLIHRLALIGARTSMASKTGFFDRAEGHASSVYKTIKGKLQKAIAGHTHSLMDVLEGLQTGLGDHTIPVSHHVSDKMLSYLQPMRSGFLPAPHLEVPPSPPVGLAPA
ncbi:hypothetical protein Loa_00481 [Legionella oakridgensis ATCC 33761 = DSM 21215]|uniref:Uncharacterized protein n=2 Tax=Legionella oakridgensis TaxID=29423 RepID=W0BBP4_9GAMM|nr:hypothetical protein [Legionella oakridgensis]AHE66052.1 hypothetical protein Loa_00481 [Legionella oakridgensis ATCC 33761 = DSM 21215]